MNKFLFFGIFIGLLMGFSISLAQSGQGQVRGTVRSEEGEPLVGATILIPSIGKGAYSNEQGIFSIDKLPAGDYQIIATYFGYDSVRKSISVSNIGAVTIGFALSPQDIYTDEVEITGTKPTGEIDKTEVDIGVTEISAKEIKLLPSVGSPDLAQFLQVLPGVVFTGDQGGQLYIRGGTPIQNMVLLDDMVIYSPFHSIGLFSVFDPDYTRNIDVYTAAFPGQYGGRVSSVIDIKTKTGSFTKYKGKVNVNPFLSGVLLEGPLVKSKRKGGGLSFLLSARNNYIDQTSPILYNYVNDTAALPFNFLDLYGKITVSDGVNTANLFGFVQTDQVDYGFPASFGWNASGGGANFQVLPSGAGAIISGNFAYSNYRSALLSDTENFPRESEISGFNGALKLGYIVNSIDEINFGLSLLGFSTDYLFTNSFGLQSEQISNNTEAAFHFIYKKVIQNRDQSNQLVVLEPSLHAHYYNNQTTVRLEPRLRAKFNFPRFSVSLGTGTYSQNLFSATSDRDVVNLFQGYLSAPEELAEQIKNHTLQTGWHGLAGVEMQLFPGVTTTVEGWYKNFTQLTNINRDRLFPEDPEYITETGEAYGIDLIVKYVTPTVYVYATYGWSKSLRTDRLGDPEPRVYPPIFDRRHNANFVFAYQLGRFDPIREGGRLRRPKFRDSRWEFSMRWNLGSGFPFTQTQGFYEQLNFRDGALTDLGTQNGSLGLLLSDDLNGGRLPYYHRLDLSAKRRWVFNNRMLLELSANLINAYDRQNIFYVDRIRFETVYQLPVLPTLGLEARF